MAQQPGGRSFPLGDTRPVLPSAVLANSDSNSLLQDPACSSSPMQRPLQTCQLPPSLPSSSSWCCSRWGWTARWVPSRGDPRGTAWPPQAPQKQNYRHCTGTEGFAAPGAFCKTDTPIFIWIGLNIIKWCVTVMLWQFLRPWNTSKALDWYTPGWMQPSRLLSCL